MAKKKTAKNSSQRPAKRSTKAAKTKPARRPSKKAAEKTPRARAKKAPALPRPTITGEEKLFLLFKDDYHARQIFDFLRVETVRELEQFAPADIVKRLSRPIVESVERIRHRLAEKNRYLSGDEGFLVGTMKSPQWQINGGQGCQLEEGSPAVVGQTVRGRP
ncbi:MAG TPA: hypothetical protein VG826_20900 [Pirellulales bacterium]|nr:hypothetical protein [Pirellulales bacterium]